MKYSKLLYEHLLRVNLVTLLEDALRQRLDLLPGGAQIAFIILEVFQCVFAYIVAHFAGVSDYLSLQYSIF